MCFLIVLFHLASSAFRWLMIFKKCHVKWREQVNEAPICFLLFPVEQIHTVQHLCLACLPQIHLYDLQAEMLRITFETTSEGIPLRLA